MIREQQFIAKSLCAGRMQNPDMRRPRRFLYRGNYEKSMCNLTIRLIKNFYFLYK